jgi:Fur family ferric uptake transcriptional regulator
MYQARAHVAQNLSKFERVACRSKYHLGVARGSAEPVDALRRVGLRVTAPRLAVLTALAGNGTHSSVDTVVSAVRDRLGDGSAQTVYNVLRTFIDVGLVRRIEPAGRPGLYELRVGDNHHHVVCRQCGAIADVDCAVGEAPCLTAADASGYEVDEAEVIFWGRCPDCAKEHSREEKHRRV